MNKTTFEMNLPLAMPSVVKTLLGDVNGRQFLANRLSEASFRVVQDGDSLSIMASKQDPTRSYYFLFAQDHLIFNMKVYSDCIGNVHKFFLETLASELRLLISIAKEYLTDAAVSSNNVNGKPKKYIG